MRKNLAIIIVALVLVSIVSIYFVNNYINRPAVPTVHVSFLTHDSITFQNSTKFDFNVTVSVPTSLDQPLGNGTTYKEIYSALQPLVEKYYLWKFNYTEGNFKIETAAFTHQHINGGESTFNLYTSNRIVNQTQIEMLTNDLQNALTKAINNKT